MTFTVVCVPGLISDFLVSLESSPRFTKVILFKQLTRYSTLKSVGNLLIWKDELKKETFFKT